MIDVAIIEDDKDIREHVGLLVNEQADFSCIKRFHNVESAIEPLLQNPPDVLLLDITLADGINGIKGLSLFVEKKSNFRNYYVFSSSR